MMTESVELRGEGAVPRGGWTQWAWVVPALVLLGMILRYGLAVPYWDQFEFADLLLKVRTTGSMSWADMHAQHNESRFVIPRLLALGLAQVTGWNQRAEMMLGWTMLVLTVVGVGRLLRSTHPLDVAGPLWAVAGFILLSLGQWQNLSWGFQFALYVPLLAIVWALVVLNTAWSYPERVGLAMALSVVSTYGFASGLAAWVLLLPAVVLAPRATLPWRVGACVAWLILTAVTVRIYLHDYAPPSGIPRVNLTEHVWEAVQFLMCFLGNGLRYTNDAEGTMWWGFFGAGVLAILSVGLLSVAAIRRDVALMRAALPWLILAGWALACGVGSTSARLALGIEHSRPPRYVSFALPLWAALPPLLYLAIQEMNRRRVWCQAITPALCLGAMLIGVQLAGLPLVRGEMLTWHNDRREGAAAIAFSQAAMNPTDVIDRVYPIPLRAQQLIQGLTAQGLMRVKVIPAEAGTDVRPYVDFSPKRLTGAVISVSHDEGRRVVSGWARSRGDPVDGVAVGVREADGRIRLVGSTVHTQELGMVPGDSVLKPYFWKVSVSVGDQVGDDQLVALVLWRHTGRLSPLQPLAQLSAK